MEVASAMLRDADPKHWKLIIFYYNPENRRLFVSKRTGLPITLNFGRPMAWVLTAGILAGLIFAAIANN
jgi:uncharacterized membrane protein